MFPVAYLSPPPFLAPPAFKLCVSCCCNSDSRKPGRVASAMAASAFTTQQAVAAATLSRVSAQDGGVSKQRISAANTRAFGATPLRSHFFDQAGQVAGFLRSNELRSSASSRSHAKSTLQGKILHVIAAAQKAEYIWTDGQEGKKGILFNEMRSKTKVIPEPLPTSGSVDSYPEWSFDGSSTGQAEGGFSDCILKPVFTAPDPIRGEPHVLVLCEVLNADGTPHATNTRRGVLNLLNEKVLAEETLFGFEQEYTMFSKAGKVYGWPENGYPHPQGPFYCGVGLESVYGRPLVEAHLEACVKAGLKISGVNAEVMPGQWEFQIGPAGPLETGDHVMVARWLLHRLGEDYGIISTFEPKPMTGDWNGAGAHTNYSTKSMREEGGLKAIHAAIEKLSHKHKEHIAVYGTGNEKRLTGKHETASIDTFKSGVADRGASIRIPLPVSLAGKGYLEDRRPAANVDPYVVTRMLIQTTLH